MNHTTIHGKVGKEPELKFSKSGTAVIEFSVACSYGRDDKKTTTWFEVKAFGQLAENIGASVNKGDTVLVSGRLETSEYQKKDGTTGKFTSLIADEVAVSLRWNVWVKDQSEKVVAKAGTVGKKMPAAATFDDDLPF